jgi:uncharacterized protein (DUF4415 family)
MIHRPEWPPAGEPARRRPAVDLKRDADELAGAVRALKGTAAASLIKHHEMSQSRSHRRTSFRNDSEKRMVLWIGGKPVPEGKSFVGVLLDSDILEHLRRRAGEGGLQRLINETLRAGMAKA